MRLKPGCTGHERDCWELTPPPLRRLIDLPGVAEKQDRHSQWSFTARQAGG